jgi:hypothetical protein
MDGPDFDLDFEPAYGEAVPVAPGVERITVNNPGPFTFFGTNSYIVGGFLGRGHRSRAGGRGAFCRR